MKAIPSSFCLPSSSSEPLFSITHHIRWLEKHNEAQSLKKKTKTKALSSSFTQEHHYMVAICALIKSSCDESMNVHQVRAYFTSVFL